MIKKDGKKKALHILITSISDGGRKPSDREDDDEKVAPIKEDEFTKRLRKIRNK